MLFAIVVIVVVVVVVGGGDWKREDNCRLPPNTSSCVAPSSFCSNDLNIWPKLLNLLVLRSFSETNGFGEIFIFFGITLTHL